MRIILFGATGRLGERVLGEALGRGHEVTAFVRDAARLQLAHPALRVVQGDVREPANVATAIHGNDAVLSCIGPGGLEGGLDLLSVGITHILDGMAAAGVDRVIGVGGAGILKEDEITLRRDLPSFPPMLQAISAQHLRSYELLRASPTRWTFVCPPNMSAGDGKGGYRAERDYLPDGGQEIALADAALFLLDELETGAFIHTRVGIAA